MAGWTKLFGSIVTSSIWCEDDVVLRVWIAMLVTCNAEGVIEGAVPGFASLCRVSLEDMQRVLGILSSPDPYSRTEEHEGRRIEKVPGGWRILNYKKFRDKGQDKEGSGAQKQKAYRDRKLQSKVTVSNALPETVTHGNALPVEVTGYTDADADEETEKEKQAKEKACGVPPTPRRRRGREEILGAFPRPIVDFALEATDRYRHLTRDGKPVRCDIPATCTNLERLHREHKLDLDACRKILALHLEDPGNYPPDLANIFGPGKPGTIPRWLTLHRAVMTLEETHA